MSASGRSALAGSLLVLAAAALWATFGLFAKTLYARGFAPLELASVRAFVGLTGIALFALHHPRTLRIRMRDLPFFAFYGIIGFALFELLYFLALERTSVSVAAALLYTAPAFVLVLSRVFLGEPIDRLGVAALALLLCGVVLVTGAAHAIATGGVHVTAPAALLGLASGLTYGVYTLASKLSLKRTGPVGAVFWSFLFATIVLAIAAPPHRALMRDAASLPLLLGLGIVPTLIAYVLYLRALTFLRATTAAMIAAVEPVIAAVLGALFLAERVSADQGLGVLAIVAGAALASRRERAQE